MHLSSELHKNINFIYLDGNIKDIILGPGNSRLDWHLAIYQTCDRPKPPCVTRFYQFNIYINWHQRTVSDTGDQNNTQVYEYA